MCGIFGTTLRYERSVVEHKLELMNFRGPDHTCIMEITTPAQDVLTFGHVRLSISTSTLAPTNPSDTMMTSALSSMEKYITTWN